MIIGNNLWLLASEWAGFTVRPSPFWHIQLFKTKMVTSGWHNSKYVQTCSTRGSISTNKCFYSRLTVATTLKFLSLVGCKGLNYVVKKVTVLSAALLFPKGSLHFTPDGLPTATLPFVWAWDWRLVTLACDSLSLGLHLLPVFNQGSFTCKGNMLTSKPWSIFQKTVPSKVFLLIHERASCHHALSDYFC